MGAVGVRMRSTLRQSFAHSLLVNAAEALRVDVIGGGEQAALIDESEYVGPEIIPAMQVRLHESRDFAQQDDAADDVDFGRIRNAYRDDRRPGVIPARSSAAWKRRPDLRRSRAR